MPTVARAASATSAPGPGYAAPPDAIRRVLEAPVTPSVSLDPQRRTMLLVDRVTLPPVADLARPMLRLGGVRIDPATNGPHGPRRFAGITIQDIATGKQTRVQIPANSNVGFPSWAPDSSRFIFSITSDNGIELWVGDPATGKARAITPPVMNMAAGGVVWMNDSRRLLVRLVPKGRGPIPQRPAAPPGPIVQETAGKTAQVRTFQDLLEDAHDEAVFDWVMTSQLAFVDTASGEITPFGTPAIWSDVDVSPDGRYLLTSRIVRPYSYIVPAGLFPEVVELWDLEDQELVRTVANVPLREEIPIQGVEKGPRGFQWRDTAEAQLIWVEALDEGDPRNKVAHRDRVMMLTPPFTGEAKELLKTEHRFTGVSWLENNQHGRGLAMLGEFDRDRRWSRTWLVDVDRTLAAPADQKPQPRLVFDRSTQDRYNAPGSLLTVRTMAGRSVVRVHDNTVYLAGQGATPEGDRPFLDKMSLETLKPERLWRSEAGSFESVIDVISPDGSRFMTSFETKDTPPNFYIRDLAATGADARRRITDFKDPSPELRAIKKQLVTYTRADGTKLSATVYTPPGYDPARDGKLPLVIWAYPLEFNDAATAGQVAGSADRFTQMGGSSHLFMLLAGYAVMDDATMPVIGDPETANDTFVEQIVSSAKAAIDKAAEMGIGDPTRVAVGGHSYGAFMTANLLAHAPEGMFRAGIARSGAYNRTLTPFGFQGERRTFWQAPETYMKLSPFTYADKIQTPVLMIHGQIDNNPGTFPMQSERLYAAVKGHGGTARLVMLPYEGHGYQARESVYHTLAEMAAWLDRWVKPVTKSESEASGG